MTLFMLYIGGKVLVNAKVTDILHNGDKVMGVRIGSGKKEAVEVLAPIVISDAGIDNTFR